MLSFCSAGYLYSSSFNYLFFSHIIFFLFMHPFVFFVPLLSYTTRCFVLLHVILAASQVTFICSHIIRLFFFMPPLLFFMSFLGILYTIFYSLHDCCFFSVHLLFLFVPFLDIIHDIIYFSSYHFLILSSFVCLHIILSCYSRFHHFSSSHVVLCLLSQYRFKSIT